MSVTSEEQEVKQTLPAVSPHESQNKRLNARLHLISGLRDRGVKAPLKWSPWLSEVNIPNYREECRQLGDPMLFTRYQRLTSPLCKKEEGEQFSDTNTPLATYSYHLKNDTRRIQSRRSKRLSEEVGREVTISELHEMMNRESLGRKRLHSSSAPQLTPHGLSITIQNTSSYNTIFDKLPKITMTIKQTNDCDIKPPQGDKPDKIRSKPVKARNLIVNPTPVKLQRGLTSFEHSLKARHSQGSTEQKSGTKDRLESNSQGFLDLQQIRRMSRSQLTKEWIHQSPLGAQKVEEEGVDKEVKVKPQRKVRFGGGDWIYRDTSFVLN